MRNANVNAKANASPWVPSDHDPPGLGSPLTTTLQLTPPTTPTTAPSQAFALMQGAKLFRFLGWGVVDHPLVFTFPSDIFHPEFYQGKGHDR
jgi:hypothetical protein